MTIEDKTQMLIELTGVTDQAMLSTYLTLAEQIVIHKAYPYGDGTEIMPAKYDTVQVEIAAYLINKRGAEGETSHSENGVSRSYEDGDIPRGILRRIVPQGVIL